MLKQEPEGRYIRGDGGSDSEAGRGRDCSGVGSRSGSKAVPEGGMGRAESGGGRGHWRSVTTSFL